MSASAVKSFEQLVAFFTAQNFPHQADPARQLVELPSKAAPLPGNLYVKWERTVPFLQLIHFMIDGVPAERVPEIETAALRLNNLLEVGGFGFDHETRRLYCRLTVPVFPSDGIEPMTLNQLGTGVVRNALEFHSVFQEIIDGARGDQVVEAYQRLAQQRRPQ